MSNENELFAKRFPERVGHIGTHYPECWKAHPSCAWRVGFNDGLADAAERVGLAKATIEELRDEVVALRRERDEARAENVAMRAVVEAIIAWSQGIPACNWTVAEEIPGLVSIPPSSEKWNRMVRAVDTYLAAQEDA